MEKQLVELDLSYVEAYRDDLQHMACSVSKMYRQSALMQRIPDKRNIYVLKGPVPFQFCAIGKSVLYLLTMRIKGSPAEIQTLTHMNVIGCRSPPEK